MAYRTVFRNRGFPDKSGMMLQYPVCIPVMRTEHLAKLRIPMFFTGVKIQPSADFISISFVIILQDFYIPAGSFFALQIIKKDCLTIL